MYGDDLFVLFLGSARAQKTTRLNLGSSIKQGLYGWGGRGVGGGGGLCCVTLSEEKKAQVKYV